MNDVNELGMPGKGFGIFVAVSLVGLWYLSGAAKRGATHQRLRDQARQRRLFGRAARARGAKKIVMRRRSKARGF